MKTLMILNDAPYGTERSYNRGSGNFCAEPVPQIAPKQPGAILQLGSRPE